MNKMIARILGMVLVPCLAAATGGFAQQTSTISGPAGPKPASSQKSEIIKLSPFLVDDSRNVGYQSSNSLAGTRLRTDLRDIGAAVQVVNREFLDDTSAKSLEDLLVYTTNTETPGMGGNFSAGNPGSGRLDFDAARISPQSNTRVRGLSSADLTQEFFGTDIPFDTFNIDRVEINRGANALLFGLGSAGGIINASLKTARFTDTIVTSFEIGRFGTHRETIDLNRVLIKEALALRVNVLKEEEQFQQEPTFEKDRRVHASVVFLPFRRTTIRANGSAGSIKANRPRVETPADRLTQWWRDGKPTWGTPLLFAQRDLTKFDSAGDVFRNPAVVFADPTSSAPFGQYDAIQPALFGTDDNIGARATFTEAGYLTTLSTSRLAAQRPADFGGRGPAGYYFDESITDRTIFDYRNTLLEGPNKGEWGDFDTFNVVLEQRLFGDRAGIELAYDRQHWKSGYHFGGSNRGQAISIDLNTALYNGAPNPNYGRPYVLSATNVAETMTWREATRVTAYAQLDFGDMFKGGAGAWLGRHMLTGLFNRQGYRLENYGFNSAVLNRSFAQTFIPGFGGTQFITSDGRGIAEWRYLGPSLANMSSPQGARIPGITALQRAGRIGNGLFYDPATDTLSGGRSVDSVSYWNSREETASGGSTVIRDNDTLSAIVQSHLLNDNLVATAGWRRDEVDQTNAPVMRDPATRRAILGSFVLPNKPDIRMEEDTVSWGVVLHAPRFLTTRLPWRSTVSAHYSESENFDAESAGKDIFGRELDMPRGVTKEAGFTVGLLDGKLSIRTNWFKSEQIGSRMSIPAPGGQFLLGIDTRVYQFNTAEQIKAAGWVDSPEALRKAMNWRQIGVHANGNPNYAFDDASVVGIQETQDVTSEGLEIEAVANPTASWRIALNVGRQEAQQANTAPVFGAYIRERSKVWFDPKIAVLMASPGPAFSVERRAREQMVVPYLLAAGQDGGPMQELREWRVNLVTNYEFGKGAGRLKGFGLGGALRWQDSSAVGFPVIETGPNVWVPDVNRPYRGDSETNVDLWFTYRMRVFGDRADCRLKFNLKNVTSGEGLIPVRSNPNGTVAQYRMEAPMLWTLSAEFPF